MKIKLTLILSVILSITAVKAQENPPVPTQEQYASVLLSALGSNAGRFQQAVRALAAYCGTEEFFFTGLGGNCDRLFYAASQGNGDAVKKVLRRLRPREVVQQSRTSTQIISTQQANVASRMAQVRAGATNSLAGLNISAGGNNLSLDMLSYLADGSDSSSDSNYDQLITPWGFFINGQITSGDYSYSDDKTEGFDFDTNGITMGIDYRVNSQSVVGLALGYADFDSTVNIGATMQSTAVTFSAYGSYNINDNLYIDARVSYGRPDFDQTRSIDFSLDGTDTNQNVLGSTEGTQQSFILSSGYQFNKNNWQFTPFVSAEFYKSQIDAFVETGASSFNVGYSEQNFETSRFTAGFQASKALSLSNGVLIPSLGYTFIHENQNGDEFVLMRVSGMPAGEFFESPTQFNDSDYSTLNLGLTFVASNGKQFYMQYTEAFGWEGFDKYNFSLGARFEF